MTGRSLAWVVSSLAVCSLAVSAVMAQDKVLIGHLGNPTPMQVAVAKNAFAEATGWEIEWRKFASGVDVVAAMSEGDIQIAELGSAPLTVAASQGVDLEIFMIAQIIGEAESLVVRNGTGIDTIAALRHKRIAVPFGSTAHFSLMGALYRVGLTEQDVTLLDMSPDQIAAAWRREAIDGAFIWQPVQSELLTSGRLLVGADRTAAWGYPTFDGWVVNKKFAARNAERLAAFVRVMDEANAAYLRDPAAWTGDSTPVKTIAERTGARPDRIPEILKGYTFLPLAKQIGPAWFGGSIAKTITYTAGFLTAAGMIDSVAEDYRGFVNAELTQAAMK